MRIGIVAGEASGDLLASGLMRAIKARQPDAIFEGVAGPRMIAEGCRPLYPLERLSVMGLVEVLGRLPELLRMRKDLVRHFTATPPDVFIGVDAPDFNLTLERQLKQAGVRTVQYVSPSVWAWRQYRVRKIAASVDAVLALFPFEAAFYEKHHVPVTFVGHPLADDIPLDPDRAGARQSIGLEANAPVVALLPGSRTSEVNKLADTLLGTAQWCLERRPDLRFVVPLANAGARAAFEPVMARHGTLPLTLLDGRAQDAMTAADVVVLASGTATLEAALLKRPMVVTHRVSALSYHIMKRMAKVQWISLPNLLSGRALVPELIQDQSRAENIGAAVLDYLDHPDKVAALQASFLDIHHTLRQDASSRAAEAVLGLLADKDHS